MTMTPIKLRPTLAPGCPPSYVDTVLNAPEHRQARPLPPLSRLRDSSFPAAWPGPTRLIIWGDAADGEEEKAGAEQCSCSAVQFIKPSYLAADQVSRMHGKVTRRRGQGTRGPRFHTSRLAIAGLQIQCTRRWKLASLPACWPACFHAPRPDGHLDAPSHMFQNGLSRTGWMVMRSGK